jgi:hypothetical protein
MVDIHSDRRMGKGAGDELRATSLRFYGNSREVPGMDQVMHITASSSADVPRIAAFD